MKYPPEAKGIGGQGFHIGDCYVWAEIYYLDSPTDFREYLPKNADIHPRYNDEGFRLLDSERTCSSSGLLGLFVVALTCFAGAGYLLYTAINGF